ncbi:MAG: hypothetical protein G01um101418_133 [Parcubacteria group bacterium Gr01-1014_18]|nr:MAG: hypothetical protein Greene041636_437 [Parcubacteria group bacterium Greene0416_36]TSC81460.1 MAG: hypothetical protein G01um101418_133 [Parcubacteria group bacterium Gr01-1014_18]TSC99058.1 MAG: hypothetical protein Greene101420_414 [Parcubacteria group bacterium Greene1014_20]TSD07261.1 MAG: hypothetical protein Greene07142_277 [Parcubacteria group bacterium Greene0714_2]
MKNWKTAQKKMFLKKIEKLTKKVVSQATKEISFDEAMGALENGERKMEQVLFDLFSTIKTSSTNVPPPKPQNSEFLRVIQKDLVIPACDGKATIAGSNGFFSYIDPNFKNWDQCNGTPRSIR